MTKGKEKKKKSAGIITSRNTDYKPSSNPGFLLGSAEPPVTCFLFSGPFKKKEKKLYLYVVQL